MHFRGARPGAGLERVEYDEPFRRLQPLVLKGCTTFNAIAAGSPGMSRALLTRRLRELRRAGVIAITPKSDGHGSLYEPTAAGRDAWRVLQALGQWGDRWTEMMDEHADPSVVLTAGLGYGTALWRHTDHRGP